MIGLVENRHLIYALILIAKIIENTLSTYRLIVVADGKKNLGAILNGLVGLVWIIGTSSVLLNLTQDLWKAFYFILGSIIGSWLGNTIEEKVHSKEKE